MHMSAYIPGKTAISSFLHKILSIDWLLFFALIPLTVAGLITMASFTSGGENYFFERQLIWFSVAILAFFGASSIDWRFLKRTNILLALYFISIALLVSLFIFGTVSRGAQSWFQIGAFSFQPVDPIKIVVILVLAKYFSRRHIEIAHFRHILVSGLYAFVPFALVFLQPDLGSAIIIAAVWLGMVMVSGVSKKHLALVFLTGALAFAALWNFGFAEYQKVRITSFLNPMTDTGGAGYNARQSMIAIGSGGLFGKGVGYGTQSRLEFLPEFETDFIFAAFVEEWGFVGAIVMLGLFGIVFWRILASALRGSGNFEVLFGVGIATFIASHFIIHIGMNVGLFPVTGITLPFVSYGGSHLVTEFAALGMVMGMRRYSRIAHREAFSQEVVPSP